jgi:hypothetical protein
MYEKQSTGSNLHPLAVDMVISSPTLFGSLHPASQTPCPKTRGILGAREGALRGVQRGRKSPGRARGAHTLGSGVRACGRRGPLECVCVGGGLGTQGSGRIPGPPPALPLPRARELRHEARGPQLGAGPPAGMGGRGAERSAALGGGKGAGSTALALAGRRTVAEPAGKLGDSPAGTRTAAPLEAQGVQGSGRRRQLQQRKTAPWRAHR